MDTHCKQVTEITDLGFSPWYKLDNFKTVLWAHYFLEVFGSLSVSRGLGREREAGVGDAARPGPRELRVPVQPFSSAVMPAAT